MSSECAFWMRLLGPLPPLSPSSAVRLGQGEVDR